MVNGKSATAFVAPKDPCTRAMDPGCTSVANDTATVPWQAPDGAGDHADDVK
jgi:hypothetical protein